MQVRRAAAGGILGAAAAFTLTMVSRWVLSHTDDPLALLGGIPFYGAHGLRLVVAGALQLLIGAITALLYGFVFQRGTGRAGWKVGGMLGLVHAGVAGLVIAFLPLLHRDSSPWTIPGAFLSFRGSPTMLGMIAAHVIYGMIVGAWCRPVLELPAVPTARWREVYPGRRVR